MMVGAFVGCNGVLDRSVPICNSRSIDPIFLTQVALVRCIDLQTLPGRQPSENLEWPEILGHVSDLFEFIV